jgi:hypothetical protein
MPDPKSPNPFEQAAQEQELTLVGEFIAFLRENKKWWLAPVLVVMVLVAALAIAGNSAAAPFIYTLF